MLRLRKSDFAPWLLAIVTMSVISSGGCRGRQAHDGAELNGEPEQYSATIVRIVDDEAQRETTTSREARSGDQRREEWTESGHRRALIWRPDLGKSFVLDLDGHVYIEVEIADSHTTERPSNIPNAPSSAGNAAANSERSIQTIDRYFDDRPPPSRVETRVLPQVVIDGHPCEVFEQRAIFADGHIEITRRFRARDLSGLALRVESESEHGTARVITERRDVRIDVAPDAFIVPPDFNRVEKLPR